MSLKEKLTTVCSQSDDIYIKGYKAGEDCGYQEGFTEGEAAGMEAGMEAGRQAESDAFWDNQYKNITNANYMFAGQGWNDNTFRPTRDIVLINTNTGYGVQADYVFAYSNITDIAASLKAQGVTLDTSKASSLAGLFRSAKTRAVPIIDTSNTIYLNNMFSFAENLVTIEKLIWTPYAEMDVTRVFYECASLENVVIEGTIKRGGLSVQWSPKLTVESLVSILEALADYSEDTTHKITLGSENIAKLTTEQLAIAENKGWTVA